MKTRRLARFGLLSAIILELSATMCKNKAEDDAPSSASKKAKTEGAKTEGPSASELAAAAGTKVTSALKAKAKGDGPIARGATPRPARVDGSVTLIHWNVGGLNGLLNGKDAEARKALLKKLVAEEAPDVLAISEHKLSEEKKAAGEKALLDLVPGYAAHWAICTAKKGYSGVVCLVKDGTQAAVLEVDTVGALHEGRTITLALDGLSVVAAYVPNSGQSLDRLSYRTDTWEPAMLAHLQKLEATAPCVLFGDLNVAHLDADIWNVGAKHLVKSAGTTPQERAAFGKLLDAGYVDAFRHLHPDATGCFSYWSTRSGNQHLNRGLRLDYAVVSASLAGAGDGKAAWAVHDCQALAEYAPNGDHCPTLVTFKPKA